MDSKDLMSTDTNHLKPEIKPEIDFHSSRLIVGFIAFLMPIFVSVFASTKLDSISASYCAPEDTPRNIFVGCLFAIAAFLLSYNGYNWRQAVLSKIAAVAAVGVALFPCQCASDVGTFVGRVHYVSAAVLFLILTIFCFLFYCRAKEKPSNESERRAWIYGFCGVAMLLSIVAIGIHNLIPSVMSTFPRFTFFAEQTALYAFGISWLVASLKFPFVTSREERLPLLKRKAGSKPPCPTCGQLPNPAVQASS